MSSVSSSQRNPFEQVISLIRDIRFLRVVGQLVFLALLIFALTQIWNNIWLALESRNLTPNFEFLQGRAGFEIGGAAGYTPDDTYWDAFLVGLRNTLATVSVGLVGATIIGILGGIFLLSTNWLVRTITRAIVEVLRNTPLLVQIVIMFFVVVLSLPPLRESIQIPAEGILPIPVRYFLYIVVGLGGWRYVRGLQASQDHWRAFLTPAFFAAVIAIEVGFWLYYNQPEIGRSLYAKIDLSDSRFWLYVIASIIAVVGLMLAGKNLRMTLSGLVVGQLIGGLIFTAGIVPMTSLRIETQPAFFLNNRGMVYPEVLTTARFAEWFAYVAFGVGLGLLLFFYLRRQTELTGQPNPRGRLALGLLLIFAVVGWLIVSSEPLPSTVVVEQDGQTVTLPLETAREQGLLTDELLYSSTPIEVIVPRRQGLRFGSGITLSPEYMALTLALIIYTAAFIAEIVRAGILAVPHGQVEAARALGLTSSQLLRMVILPQALRVIIPPLTNQYLNLAKNSSLAIAISFADVYQVMNTVGNQSGQSVTSIVIVMLTYLLLSLIISAAMNWVNGRFQLVTR
ncbi:MAG TPA: ABC transporter permease subunit [Oceanobacillus sp.]|nr:ABC transporter permease subunit [Oceanobacillus sp.]